MFCHFCGSEEGEALFTSALHHVSICSTCVSRLMVVVYEFETLETLDEETATGH